MGGIKPLLPWGDTAAGEETLLSHAVATCRAAGIGRVAVVVGAYADEVVESVPDGCLVVRNDRWEEGPGTSIVAGVEAISDASRVLILLCDTPLVTADDVRRVVAAVEGGVVAAAASSETIGPPACFDARLFDDLRSLDATRGAKPLLMRLGDEVARIPMPNAFVDLDTPEQYAAARA